MADQRCALFLYILPVKACLVLKQHVAPAAVQGSNTPYQVSSDTYTLEARDPGIISALRSFGRLLANTPLGSTAYLKRIKDIRAGGFFDIICRVTSWHNTVYAICLTLPSYMLQLAQDSL